MPPMPMTFYFDNGVFDANKYGELIENPALATEVQARLRILKNPKIKMETFETSFTSAATGLDYKVIVSVPSSK